MPFFDESAWEVYAWVSTALLTWGTAMLFYVHCTVFNVCLPAWWLPGPAWLLIDLFMLVAYSIGAYFVWQVAGWGANLWPLIVYFGAHFLFLIATFFMYIVSEMRQEPGNRSRAENSAAARAPVIIAGVAFLVAALATIASSIGFYLVPQAWAGTLAVLAAAWFIARGILNFVLAAHLGRAWDPNVACGPCQEKPDGVCLTPLGAKRAAAAASSAPLSTSDMLISSIGLPYSAATQRRARV